MTTSRTRFRRLPDPAITSESPGPRTTASSWTRPNAHSFDFRLNVDFVLVDQVLVTQDVPLPAPVIGLSVWPAQAYL